jgi:hypothetical protein
MAAREHQPEGLIQYAAKERNIRSLNINLCRRVIQWLNAELF